VLPPRTPGSFPPPFPREQKTRPRAPKGAGRHPIISPPAPPPPPWPPPPFDFATLPALCPLTKPTSNRPYSACRTGMFPAYEPRSKLIPQRILCFSLSVPGVGGNTTAVFGRGKGRFWIFFGNSVRFFHSALSDPLPNALWRGQVALLRPQAFRTNAGWIKGNLPPIEASKKEGRITQRDKPCWSGLMQGLSPLLSFLFIGIGTTSAMSGPLPTPHPRGADGVLPRGFAGFKATRQACFQESNPRTTEPTLV